MARYRLSSEWRLEAPQDHVWDALLQVVEWPAWWLSIRSVERIADGDSGGVGMRLRQRWRSLLPVTLTLELEMLEVEPGCRLEARTSGDFSGTCTFTFEGATNVTVVTFAMDISPTRAWMNLPVPFASRIAQLNFQAVMRQGGEGLARRLRELADQSLAPAHGS